MVVVPAFIACSAYLYSTTKTGDSNSTESEFETHADPLEVIAQNQSITTLNGPVIKEYHLNTYAANNPLEDTHDEVIVNRTGHPTHAFFAVYDGHGGTEAAQFAKEDLITIVQHELDEYYALQHSKLPPEQLEKIHEKTQDAYRSIPSAIVNAFLLADNFFLNLCLADKEQRRNAFTGACALLAYIVNRKIYVANAGDSRAVVGRFDPATKQWTAIPLSRDLNTSCEAERKRLQAEHPNEPDILKDDRVKGHLIPTRALGDGLFKSKVFNEMLVHPFPEPFNPPYLTASPEITAYDLHPNDRFIVLGTDGLFETLTNEDIVQIVADTNSTGSTVRNASTNLIRRVLEDCGEGDTPEERLRFAVEYPLKRLIHDDCTVTVAFFNDNTDTHGLADTDLKQADEPFQFNADTPKSILQLMKYRNNTSSV